jgi:preprotein translocase subunit SecG
MLKIINFAQIVVSVILVVLILLQNKGSGLSSVFGGEGSIAHTKRGPEKWVFYGTIVGVVIFVVLGVVNLFLVSQGQK